MKVKVLRDAIANLPDDLDVVISDVNGACLEVISVSVAAPLVYIDTRQEFPDTWFDQKTNQEYRWINGSPVVLNPESMKYEYIMDIGGREKEVELTLYDGYGEGKGIKVKYPKLEDLLDEQIEDMDKQLGGRISDSGYVALEDVCCCYAEVDNDTPPKEEPVPENPKPKIEPACEGSLEWFLRRNFGLEGAYYSAEFETVKAKIKAACTDEERQKIEEEWYDAKDWEPSKNYSKEAWEAWRRALIMVDDLVKMGLISEDGPDSPAWNIRHGFCDNAG